MWKASSVIWVSGHLDELASQEVPTGKNSQVNCYNCSLSTPSILYYPVIPWSMKQSFTFYGINWQTFLLAFQMQSRIFSSQVLLKASSMSAFGGWLHQQNRNIETLQGENGKGHSMQNMGAQLRMDCFHIKYRTELVLHSIFHPNEPVAPRQHFWSSYCSSLKHTLRQSCPLD